MEIIGYLSSILIGVALGLIGGGGSILTVPVLVYLFQVDAVLATAYSLFIVGLTSAVGSVTYFKKGLVKLDIALVRGKKLHDKRETIKNREASKKLKNDLRR